MKVLIFLLFALFLTQSAFSQEEEEKKPWCWTAPVKLKPGEDWDPVKGGLNWGFCKDLKKEEEQVYYKITVTTANLEGAESDAQFLIKIYGQEGQTPNLILSKNGFGKGTVVTFKVLGKNVGDVNQITLTQKGNDPYRCLKIRVEQGTRLWDFDCDDFISCPMKCSEDMFLTGNQLYTVTCQTDGVLWAGTKDPVYIQFQGPLAKTPKKILSEKGFIRGEMKTVELIAKDVGEIYAITVSMTTEDAWLPQKCVVRRSIGDEVEFEFRGMSVKCPARCKVTITNFAVLERVLGISLSGNAAGDVEKKEKEEEEGSSSSSSGGGGGGSGSPAKAAEKMGDVCNSLL